MSFQTPVKDKTKHIFQNLSNVFKNTDQSHWHLYWSILEKVIFPISCHELLQSQLIQANFLLNYTRALPTRFQLLLSHLLQRFNCLHHRFHLVTISSRIITFTDVYPRIPNLPQYRSNLLCNWLYNQLNWCRKIEDTIVTSNLRADINRRINYLGCNLLSLVSSKLIFNIVLKYSLGLFHFYFSLQSKSKKKN